MKTTNDSPSGFRSADTTRGRLGVLQAGTPGIRVIDANGTEVIQVTTLRVPWVVDLSEYEAQLGSDTGSLYTNATGSNLYIGDVVVLDGTTVITTTTAQDTRPVGVIVAGGDDAALVAVQTAGYVALVNVTAAVSAGNYLETSTTAAQATENPTRRAGSFGVILTSGTTPSALLFGVTDSSDSGSTPIPPNTYLTTTLGGQPAINTIPASGAAATIDCSLANIFDITLTANCTLTITNPPPAGVGGLIIVILRQGGTGSYTVTWPGTVVWQDPTDGTTGGSAPTLWTAVGAQDVVGLSTENGGVDWGGSHDLSFTFATPAIVLGTAGSAGTGASVIRHNSTIAAFDATVPVTQAFSDAAATGSVAFAARRDHRHGMPAASGVGEILISDTPSTPLVFADLIQNEAQDDLVYADP